MGRAKNKWEVVNQDMPYISRFPSAKYASKFSDYYLQYYTVHQYYGSDLQ